MSTWMRLLRCCVPLCALMGLSGCYKDDLDPVKLTNNPFDPGYTGPNVFRFDTTYTELVDAGQASFTRQVFQFRVNSSLFLEPQSYSVQVDDLVSGSSGFVQQLPPGSDVLRYYRNEYIVGQEVCVKVSLSNNFHTGREETICGTLQ
jgi:hypothetical protein